MADKQYGDVSRNVKITSVGVAIPVDIQYSDIAIQTVTFLTGAAVRDTNRIWRSGIDFTKVGRLSFLVDNTHDQAVRIYFNHVDVGDLTRANGTPAYIEVPANRTQQLITPADDPLLGAVIGVPIIFGIMFPVAPTVGELSFSAFIEPIV